MNDTKEYVAGRWRLAVLLLAPVVVAWLAVMASPIALELESTVFALLVVVFFVTIYASTMTTSYADRWASARAARFGPDETAVIAQHLARTRAGRALGVTLGGFGIPGMLMAAYNADQTSVPWYPDVFATGSLWPLGLGYLVASVICELTKPRLHHPGAGSTGTTIVLRRRFGDFLDPFPQWTLKLYGTLAMGATLVGVMLLVGGDGELLEWSPARGRVGGDALVGLGCLASAIVLSRRRERAPDEAAVAYEELTRTATVNALAGTAVAMFGSYILGIWSSLEQLHSGLLSAVLVLTGFFGLMVWITTGTGLRFRTSRLDRLRSAT